MEKSSGIYLNIAELEENTKISNVEEVRINVSKNQNEVKKVSNVSEGQLNNIKEFLMDTYGIDKNKIHINEE